MKRIIESNILMLFLAFLIFNARNYYNPRYPELNVLFTPVYNREIDHYIIHQIQSAKDYKRNKFLTTSHIIKVVEDNNYTEDYIEVTSSHDGVMNIEMQINANRDLNRVHDTIFNEFNVLFGVYLKN